MRDPLANIVHYNKQFVVPGRDPGWVRTKLDRLCASPFGFLRGTFHLFSSDWNALGDDPLNPGPPQPIVGDLHLENFGAFRAEDGRVVFDVNDFDETAAGSPALDLGRVATSFLLADEKHGELRAVDRIEAFLASYLAAARAADLRAIDDAKGGKGMPPAVMHVIGEAEAGSRPAWLESRVEGEGGKRHFRKSEKYFPVEDAQLRAAVQACVREFTDRVGGRPADCPSWPTVLDVAVRIAGTGSLGRFRYAVLMPGKGGKAGHELILELKEALPSSLAPADSNEAQAARVIAFQRQLQGASPAYLGVATLGGRAFTVRELQPMEAKLDSAATRGGELDALCAACGTVLGRLHRRAAPDTLVGRLQDRDRALARRVAAFALRYAEVVTEDHAQLVRERASVEKQLGLK
jgi:uncharacterized protein (DUF2252 family)